MLTYRRVLLTTDAVGGVWRYSLELARELVTHGARVFLAVLGPPPDAEQTREAAGIPGLKIHLTGLPLDWTADSPKTLERAAQTLARLGERTKADTIQLHSPGLMGSATWPAPVIATAHSCVGTWWRTTHDGPLPADLAWRAEAVADGLAAADAVIVPSASFADLLRETYGVRRQIQVVLNGRRPSVAPATAEGRRPMVLTAGRLWDEGKRVAVLDEAAARISFPVYAAGAPTNPNGVTASYHHLHMLGLLGDAALAKAYAEAAVFASPAIYEPFGLAVLEAAQAGCALVLSDIPTFRELWQDSAVFVPPNDPAALSDALNSLLADSAALAQRGALAHERAAHFGAGRMGAKTWAIHLAVQAREAV